MRRVVHALLAIAVSTAVLVVFPAGASATPAALSNYQITLSPLATVPPGGATATYAQCPSGTHVVGGGMYADYTQSTFAPVWGSSYPAHLDGVDRWGGQVNNTGSQAFTIRFYAVCLGGVDQYEVRTLVSTIGAGQPVGLGAACPETVSAIGGGFAVETGWGYQVSGVIDWGTSASHPRGPSGWNRGTQDQRWVAHAVCGSVGTAEVQTVRTRPTRLPGGTGFVDVSCPAGMSVLAGGGGVWSSDAGLGVSLLASYPVSSSQWRSALRVDSPGGANAEGWAVCAR